MLVRRHAPVALRWEVGRPSPNVATIRWFAVCAELDRRLAAVHDVEPI